MATFRHAGGSGQKYYNFYFTCLDKGRATENRKDTIEYFQLDREYHIEIAYARDLKRARLCIWDTRQKFLGEKVIKFDNFLNGGRCKIGLPPCRSKFDSKMGEATLDSFELFGKGFNG